MKRRYTSAQLSAASQIIFNLTARIEKRYGRFTRYWDMSDQDVQHLMSFGYKVWGQKHPLPQISDLDPQKEADWLKIVKCYKKHGFARLTSVTHFSWEHILELNRLHGDCLTPDFAYYALPLNPKKSRIYACTLNELVSYLRLQHVRFSKINNFAVPKGYWILHGNYPWDRVARGDMFLIQTGQPAIAKKSKILWKNFYRARHQGAASNNGQLKAMANNV